MYDLLITEYKAWALFEIHQSYGIFTRKVYGIRLIIEAIWKYGKVPQGILFVLIIIGCQKLLKYLFFIIVVSSNSEFSLV